MPEPSRLNFQPLPLLIQWLLPGPDSPPADGSSPGRYCSPPGLLPLPNGLSSLGAGLFGSVWMLLPVLGPPSPQFSGFHESRQLLGSKFSPALFHQCVLWSSRKLFQSLLLKSGGLYV